MGECCNPPKMHFIIAQTMLKYLSKCRYNLYPLARHICLSAEIVKQRVKERHKHRDVLWRGAKRAAESGAAPTALWYYKVCIDLLQEDRWNENAPDVYYDETLQLYVHTAEQHFLQGDEDAAMELLTETFVNGKTAADKVRSWILWSRIYAKRGDFIGAFYSLSCSLGELGLLLPPTTRDKCDIEFKKLEYRIREMDRDELVGRQLSEDKNVTALGT